MSQEGGILLTAILAVSGGTSLPLGSKYITRSFGKDWLSNASKLESGMDTLIEDALQRIKMHLSESISPYTRFVKSEDDALLALHKKMESGIADATRLRQQINKSCE